MPWSRSESLNFLPALFTRHLQYVKPGGKTHVKWYLKSKLPLSSFDGEMRYVTCPQLLSHVHEEKKKTGLTQAKTVTYSHIYQATRFNGA